MKKLLSVIFSILLLLLTACNSNYKLNDKESQCVDLIKMVQSDIGNPKDFVLNDDIICVDFLELKSTMYCVSYTFNNKRENIQITTANDITPFYITDKHEKYIDINKIINASKKTKKLKITKISGDKIAKNLKCKLIVGKGEI